MRTILLTLAFLAFVPITARADDASDLVEKAVRATASSDLRLNRLGTVVRVDRGVLNLPVGQTPVQRTVYLNPPDRLKYDAIVNLGGQPQLMVLALNGVNGWKKEAGAIKDLSPAEYDVVQDEAYAGWLMTLLPLRQRGVQIKPIPPTTIAGKPAQGVSLARPNRSDVRLYFAGDTGLLVQIKLKVRESGIDVDREYDLSGHKEFDGIKLPTKIIVTQRGRKIEDWSVESYRTPDRLDDKVFAKPK